jgi:hypothetical protein
MDQLLHEQIQGLGFIRYNGGLEVHSSLLNVVLSRLSSKGRGFE